MSVSPYVRDLVCCKQTAAQGEEFDKQSYLVFSNSEQGYVDVQSVRDREIPLSHGPTAVLGVGNLQLADWTIQADDPLTRIHTVEKLQHFLDVSQ